jgi:hypothetical protein
LTLTVVPAREVGNGSDEADYSLVASLAPKPAAMAPGVNSGVKLAAETKVTLF